MFSCSITFVFSCLLTFPFNPINISSNRCPQLTRTSLSSSSFLYPTSLAILSLLLSPYCSKSPQFLHFLFQSPLYSLRKCYIGSPIPHIIHTLCLSSYQFPNIISVSFKLLYLALDTDQFGFFTRLSNKFISNKSNKLQFHTFALMPDYLSLSTLSTVLYFSRFY